MSCLAAQKQRENAGKWPKRKEQEKREGEKNETKRASHCLLFYLLWRKKYS